MMVTIFLCFALLHGNAYAKSIAKSKLTDSLHQGERIQRNILFDGAEDQDDAQARGKSKDLLARLKDPTFRLDDNEYEKLETIFLRDIEQIDFKMDQDIPKGANSQEIVQIIKKELSMHTELFKCVVDSTDFTSYNGENDVVRNILENSIFPFIKKYNAQVSEKKRYKRMLDSLENSQLTKTDQIVINAFSRAPDVNSFLFDLATNNGQTYRGTLRNKRKIFKAQALLLQNALRNKLQPHSPSLLLRAYTTSRNGDPLAGNSKEVFDKFISTMDVSELTEGAVENEFKRMNEGMGTGPRMRMEFVETKQGYEIAPWVKMNYIFQREVLLPIGASYTPKRIDKKKAGYNYVYEMRDHI